MGLTPKVGRGVFLSPSSPLCHGEGSRRIPGMPCLDQGMAPAAIQAKLQPVPTWELSDLMPSCGRRLLGPGVLSQLELFELNVTENERRRETAGT